MFSSVDLQVACRGAQHWLWRCEWFSGQCGQKLCSWPWQHLSLSWRMMTSLSKSGFAVPSRHHIDLHMSKNLVGELALALWHLLVRKAQKADAEEGPDYGYPEVPARQGFQFSVARCVLNVLLQWTLRYWSEYVSSTKSMDNIPLLCFNLSWRALHLNADQWIWLLPLS